MNDQNDLETMWYMCTMEFHSAVTKHMLPPATTGMGLEHVTQSETTQTEKDKHV